MNKGVCKETLLLEIVVILMSLTMAPYVTHCSAVTKCDEICETFSPPVVEDDEDNESYLRVNVAETNSMLSTPGAPQLPLFFKNTLFSTWSYNKKYRCLPLYM